MGERHQGFTIVETMLFLAISAAFLTVVMVAVTSTTRTSRFQEAVNATTSYLQKQYSEVAAGRNARPLTGFGCSGGVVNTSNQAVGSSNCVVLGRLIDFGDGSSSQMKSRYIVGDGSLIGSLPASDSAAIVAMNPTLAPTTMYDGTFLVPWGVTIADSKSSAGDVRFAAIIRSVVSGKLLIYTFYGASASPSLDAANITTTNLNRDVRVCLSEQGARTAYVRIGVGQGQDVIRSDFATQASGACA